MVCQWYVETYGRLGAIEASTLKVSKPDSKLEGGLMRLVQALSGATRTGFKLVEAYEKLDAVAASTLKEANLV